MLAYSTARLFSLTHADTVFANADSNPLQVFSSMFHEALVAQTIMAHVHPGGKQGIFGFAVNSRLRHIERGEAFEKKMSPGPLKKLFAEYLFTERAFHEMEAPYVGMKVMVEVRN